MFILNQTKKFPFVVSIAFIVLGSGGVAKAANVIVNGDFVDGNVGFTSDYEYVTPIPGNLNAPDVYTIGTNPGSIHSAFASFGDHTTGTGDMMIVNGSTLPNQTVWQQTINVTPNTEYNFATWIASAVPGQPAELQFSINSTLIGDIFTAPTTTGNWEEFNATWNSASNTQAIVSIVDLNQAFGGNDFALDDISMEANSEPVPEPLTILGSVTALGIGGFLKREHSKKQKKS